MRAARATSLHELRHPDNFRLMVWVSAIVHAALMVGIVTLPGAIRPKSVPIIVNIVNLPGGGGPRPTAKQQQAPPPAKAPEAPKPEPEAAKPKLTYPEKTKPTKKPEPTKKVEPAKSAETSAAKPPAKAARTIENSFVGREFQTGVGMEGAGDSGLEGFPFAYYLMRIRDKISSNWFQSIVVGDVKGQYIVTVFFRIMRDGRIADVQVELSSGISSLDMSAQRAVYASNPMPALPQGYAEDTLNVHFRFVYEK